ncbi:MAG TPA: head GIN domain-containing protein [Pyrinomonadaceae bacterium]|jgi:hypothetical protein|nr:head GIN domain-containing protein [Pyrinomonadaceae bacterium]
MKKFGFLIFAFALVVGLVAASASSIGKLSSGTFDFHFGGVKGSGNVVKERRDSSGFHAIEVGNAIQVEITAQKDFNVEVEADDNIVPLIKTEVIGGVLKITCEKSHISTSSPMRVRISAPDIDALESSGASNITIAGIKNTGISVDSSGASKVKIDGETSKLTVELSGASKFDATSLTAENGIVDVSGASNASVNVTGSLRADASGASRVSYAGSPRELIKKASGASSISGQ